MTGETLIERAETVRATPPRSSQDRGRGRRLAAARRLGAVIQRNRSQPGGQLGRSQPGRIPAASAEPSDGALPGPRHGGVPSLRRAHVRSWCGAHRAPLARGDVAVATMSVSGVAARSRRIAPSVSADSRSSHCASSTAIVTGCSSTAERSTSASARPSASGATEAVPLNLSAHSGSTAAKAARAAEGAATTPGALRRPPRASASTPLQGSALSASTARAAAMDIPSSRSRVSSSSSSRVLPIPASPSSTRRAALRFWADSSHAGEQALKFLAAPL